MRLELTLLGEPQLRVAGESRALKVPRRTWPLLALLALNERPWSRASLATVLWPDEQEARAALRRHLHGLTTILPHSGRWLASDAQTIGWNHDAPCRVDTTEFRRAIQEKRFCDAVDLYRGDLLGVLFDEAILEERERLRELYLDALSSSIESMRAEHNYSAAVRYAEKLLDADEFREDAVRDLMRARYEDGDRSGAIAAYERFAKQLHQELHAHPMVETTALRDAIISGSLPEQSAAPRDAGPFVGRARELAELKTAWNRAVRGNVGAVFLSGEAGIGKTRLANEFCNSVAEQNACVLRGRTSSPEAAPFEAIVEALEDNLASVRREDLDDAWWSLLTTVLPSVAALYPGLSESPQADDRALRKRLHEALARLLVAMSARRPLMILLEDLHWAGSETLELLEGLTLRAVASPALLLATYRNEERIERRQLDAMRRRFVHERKAVSLALGRLRDNEIREIATRIVGDRGASHGTERISAIASGHPLFAIQLARYYADSGVLPGESASLDNVAEAVVRRCERLPDDARTLVQIASLFESSFTIEELASAAGWEESRTLDALGALLDAKFIGERGGGKFAYAFTHALIESAVRDLVEPASRRGRRRRIAAVLEETRAGDASAAALIASHWEAGGENAPAIRAHLQAARVARERFAYGDAIAHADRALALLPDDERRFEALLVKASARKRIGNYRDGLDEFAELEMLARQLNPERQFEFHWIRCTGGWVNKDEYARAVASFVEFAAGSGRKDWIAQADFARAHALIHTGDFPRAVEILRSLYRTAREDGNDKVRHFAAYLLIQVLYFSTELDAGLALTDELADEYERTGEFHVLAAVTVGYEKYANITEFADPAIAVKARHYHGVLAERHERHYMVLMGRMELADEMRYTWDVATARREYEECARIAREMGSTEAIVYAFEKLGELEIGLGDYDRALELLAQAMANSERDDERYSLGLICTIQTAKAHLAAGRPAKALENAAKAFGSAISISDPYVASSAHSALGAAEFAAGDRAKGLALTRQGVEMRRRLRCALTFQHELGMYLDALLLANKDGEAQAIAAELTPLFLAAPHRQRAPGFLAVTLATATQRRGDTAEAARLRAVGRRAVEYVLGRLTDAADKSAFARIPANAALLAR